VSGWQCQFFRLLDQLKHNNLIAGGYKVLYAGVAGQVRNKFYPLAQSGLGHIAHLRAN
jgi:hypothetical protein